MKIRIRCIETKQSMSQDGKKIINHASFGTLLNKDGSPPPIIATLELATPNDLSIFPGRTYELKLTGEGGLLEVPFAGSDEGLRGSA